MTQVASELDPNLVKIFHDVCSSSICRALKQISPEDFEAPVMDSTPISGDEESAGVWVRFSAPAWLTGEIGFFVSQPDAFLLSGLLRRQAPEKSAELEGGLREAVAEVFHRFVAEATSVLQAKTKDALEFVFRGFEPPRCEADFRCRLEVRGSKTRPFQVFLVADQGLVKAAATLAASAVSPSASDPEKLMGSSGRLFQGKENIGLLMDMELEATLRFGEREMLLREVLNLSSGSVIELNHRVSDPVELLVCGKVVAKGEVVVLDGNYALRVTQVGSQADRMSSLLN